MKALKLDNASICICGVLLRHHPRLVPPNSSIATMSEVPQDPRSQWPKMVRHRNVTSRPARLGPSPTSTTVTALISLPPCPTRITPEALKNLHRTFSCSPAQPCDPLNGHSFFPRLLVLVRLSASRSGWATSVLSAALARSLPIKSCWSSHRSSGTKDAWYDSSRNLDQGIHELTKLALPQKYELMEYGYDQSLLIRPEADDSDDQCKTIHYLYFRVLLSTYPH
jgi:hypothetical protein